jgi:hypothetical protein
MDGTARDGMVRSGHRDHDEHDVEHFDNIDDDLDALHDIEQHDIEQHIIDKLYVVEHDDNQQHDLVNDEHNHIEHGGIT